MNWRKFGIIAAGAVFFGLYASIGLYRYNSGQLFYYDFGIFARILNDLIHLRTPYIHHMAFGSVHFLGDHFEPSLALISPILAIPDIRMLLIEQAAAVTACIGLLWVAARREGLGMFPAAACVLMYAVFAGTVNPLVSDWHPEPTAAVFLLLSYMSLRWWKNTVLPFAVSAVFLGFKESNAFTLLFLLIPLWFTVPGRRRTIGLLAISAIAWFFAATRVIMPAFSGRPYLYYPQFSSVGGTVRNIIGNPEKLRLLFQAFVSFAFIPLVSGVWIIPAFGELAIRLLPERSFFQNYTLGMHYNAFLAVFLALGSIHAFAHAGKFPGRKRVTAALALTAVLVSLYTAKRITNSPVVLATNRVFWKEFSKPNYLVRSLAEVPKSGSVMAQNNILPYLTVRREPVYMLETEYRRYDPDLVVFDLTEGQNANDFYPTGIGKINLLKDRIASDPAYLRQQLPDPGMYLFVKRPVK